MSGGAGRAKSGSPRCSVPRSPVASTSPSLSRWRTSFPRTTSPGTSRPQLDLGFVREWVRELYAERGHPSIDPVVFFKLQLVMFLKGIRSERKLIETASLPLAHRCYLGYVLDEDLPDHSSLTRIRQRLGVDVFQRFFEKVVDLCQQADVRLGTGALRRRYQGGGQRRPRLPRSPLLPRSHDSCRRSLCRRCPHRCCRG